MNSVGKGFDDNSVSIGFLLDELYRSPGERQTSRLRICSRNQAPPMFNAISGLNDAVQISTKPSWDRFLRDFLKVVEFSGKVQSIELLSSVFRAPRIIFIPRSVNE